MRRRRAAAVLALVAVVLAAGWVVLRNGDRHGADVARIGIDSKAVGETLPVQVVEPPGDPPARGRPLLVFLHGRSSDDESYLDEEMFAALAEQGERAPIVAFPYGGDHSYWHDRADGAWGRYVMREVIPEVIERFGADRRRVAVGGISMGGFGALDLLRLHDDRLCAGGGHSAAIWRGAGETAPGAFDDAEDFARHDLVGADPGDYGGKRVWLDGGDEDPFRPGIDALAARLAAAGAPVTARTWPGGHDDDYWNAHWDDYMRFYARALARC